MTPNAGEIIVQGFLLAAIKGVEWLGSPDGAGLLVVAAVMGGIAVASWVRRVL